MSAPAETWTNPYEGLSLKEIYAGLLSGRFGPRWPSESVQKNFVGTNGVDLTRRAFQFIELLDKDGAFKPGWKGFDYGCGFGRFGSTFLSKGAAPQFDLYDAWQSTIDVISKLGYKNQIKLLPEILADGSLPKGFYDFGMSFSVFTHLSPYSFRCNIPVLLSALKPDGTMYITVRHDEFFDHKYAARKAELTKTLEKDGICFIESGGDRTGAKLFGDTVVTEDYLGQFGKVRYVGMPHTLQHVYALSSK